MAPPAIGSAQHTTSIFGFSLPLEGVCELRVAVCVLQGPEARSLDDLDFAAPLGTTYLAHRGDGVVLSDIRHETVQQGGLVTDDGRFLREAASRWRRAASV